MVEDILRIALRDALIWLPIILGFGLLHTRLRHIDVSLDGIVIICAIATATVWNVSDSYSLSIALSILLGAALSSLCAILNGLLGLPTLMVGVVFSLAAHAVAVNWIGESVPLGQTALIVGNRIPWWLPLCAISVVTGTFCFYRSRIGILIRKYGDGVDVNTVYNPRLLLVFAYALSGSLYGLGAALYAHKSGTARAGGSFDFLVVSACSYLCVFRFTSVVSAAVASIERRHDTANRTRAVNQQKSLILSSPEVNALLGAVFYGLLVPIVLQLSPRPTYWKLLLALCLLLATLDYSILFQMFIRRRSTGRVKSAGDYIVNVVDMAFAYHEGPLFRPVFVNANAIFHRGLTLLKGSNGTGKSTLLRILEGRLDPQHGQVQINGSGLEGIPPNRRPVYTSTQDTRSTIGKSITVEECFLAAVTESQLSRLKMKRSVEDLYASVMSHNDMSLIGDFHPKDERFWSQIVSDLSGGQQAVIALLCAVVSSKPILLFDEPTTGLDQHHFGVLAKLLQAAAEERIVIVSTHDSRLDDSATSIWTVADGCLHENCAIDLSSPRVNKAMTSTNVD